MKTKDFEKSEIFKGTFFKHTFKRPAYSNNYNKVKQKGSLGFQVEVLHFENGK